MNLIEAYAVTDATTAMIKKEWWPCKAGCNGCCLAWVLISEAEGRQLQKLNTKSIRNRARAAIKKARGFYGQLPISELTKKMIGKTEPCPALANGLCVLYENRPMACRLYGFSEQDKELLACEKVRLAINENGGAGCIDWMEWHKQFESALTGKYRPIVAWLSE